VEGVDSDVIRSTRPYLEIDLEGMRRTAKNSSGPRSEHRENEKGRKSVFKKLIILS
jgi:hypothetical protein